MPWIEGTRVPELITLLGHFGRTAGALILDRAVVAADHNLPAQERRRVGARNSDSGAKPLIQVRRIVAVRGVDIAKMELIEQVGGECARVTNSEAARVVHVIAGAEPRRTARPETIGHGKVVASVAPAEKQLVFLRGIEVSPDIVIVEVRHLMTLGAIVLQNRAANVRFGEGLQILQPYRIRVTNQ